jgi:F0F1-type ATP synthase assembly protein I
VQQDWKNVGSYGTVGLEFALSVIVGLYGGQWLDKKFGTNGWLTILGTAFGLAAGSRAIWQALKKANAAADAETRREEEERKKYHDDTK